ncbi:MAG TPA: hypothetical protein VHX60_16890 [Acidobacteriaceae bacterium]|nr:hypothetical protein [Acidobacteriaceae bacterium]
MHGFLLIPFRGRGKRETGGRQVFDAESLCHQNTIKRRQAEAATAMKKIRYVCLSEAGLASEQGPRKNTSVDPAPDFKAQALV